ncbi:MAG: hypothetical protein ACRDPG_09020 [Nocardioidaceae bacterium]
MAGGDMPVDGLRTLRPGAHRSPSRKIKQIPPVDPTMTLSAAVAQWTSEGWRIESSEPFAVTMVEDLPEGRLPARGGFIRDALLTRRRPRRVTLLVDDMGLVRTID